jgi:hypothetical protein
MSYFDFAAFKLPDVELVAFGSVAARFGQHTPQAQLQLRRFLQSRGVVFVDLGPRAAMVDLKTLRDALEQIAAEQRAAKPRTQEVTQ